MSTYLFLNGSNDETTIVVYRWQSQGNCQTLEIIIALTGALNVEQTWYFRAIVTSLMQMSRYFQGCFVTYGCKESHQRLLFAIDLVQETSKNHLKHNTTWFIGSEIKWYWFYLGFLPPFCGEKAPRIHDTVINCCLGGWNSPYLFPK